MPPAATAPIPNDDEQTARWLTVDSFLKASYKLQTIERLSTYFAPAFEVPVKVAENLILKPFLGVRTTLVRSPSMRMVALVDTHVHLYLDAFEADRDEVVHRARQAGVVAMVLPALDVPSVHQALALCDRYPGLYAMAALHPSETKKATEADFEQIARLCEDPRVVAVGESGLDYYWDRSFEERQQQFFRKHIRLAIEKDLPLILHNREAAEDLVRILHEERAATSHPERLRGIFHCFTGPAWVAQAAAELGFLLGIGGVLTFKKSGLAELVRALPLEQVVLETDAPFLAPTPHRGKRNEPAFVRYVAEKLAELKGVSLEEVARITTANACKLFRLSVDE